MDVKRCISDLFGMSGSFYDLCDILKEQNNAWLLTSRKNSEERSIFLGFLSISSTEPNNQKSI